MTIRDALLASEDAVYRTAQVITVLHAHRARGPWLRLVAVAGRADHVELLAVQGDRIRRPGDTVGLQSNLAHLQHLETRCVADLGADPATLSGLLNSRQVSELLSTPLDEQIATQTRAIAAALDERPAQARTSRPRLWFRNAAPAAPERLDSRVAAQVAQLQDLIAAVPIVALEDVALDWDDVDVSGDTAR